MGNTPPSTPKLSPVNKNQYNNINNLTLNNAEGKATAITAATTTVEVVVNEATNSSSQANINGNKNQLPGNSNLGTDSSGSGTAAARAPVSHLLLEGDQSEAARLAEKGRELFQIFSQAQEKHAASYAKTLQVNIERRDIRPSSNPSTPNSNHSDVNESVQQSTVDYINSVLLESPSPHLYNEYEVVEPIACGTSALVCKLRSRTTGAVFAGKFARLGSSMQGRARRLMQFRLEAKIQRLCECENVVKLIEYQELKDFAVFIMEYIPTTLLRQTVESNKSHKHPELQAAIHIRSIATALKRCHSQGVVHLDVKLDNILCTYDGKAKLCDFGLAGFSPVRRTEATPLFCPPEVLTVGICTTKADTWSLGVVLYILLCGYPPFQPTSKHTLEEQITSARYTFRSSDFSGVSGLARDLVSRLLVLDVETRYSAEQVLEHPWIVASIEGEKALNLLAREYGYFSSSQPKTAEKISNKLLMDALDKLTRGNELKKKAKKVQMMIRFIRNSHSHASSLSELGSENKVGSDLISSTSAVQGDITHLINNSNINNAKNTRPGSVVLSDTLSIASETSMIPVNMKDTQQDAYDIALQSQPSSTVSSRASSVDYEHEMRARESNGSSDADTDGEWHQHDEDEDENEQKSLSTPPSVNGLEIERYVSTLLLQDSPKTNNKKFDHLARERKILEMWPRSCMESTSLQEPPVWLPNSEAVSCRCCGMDFGMFWNRKHHCRSCGQIVCDNCSKSRRIVKRVDPINPVRVCDRCRGSTMVQYRLGSTLKDHQLFEKT